MLKLKDDIDFKELEEMGFEFNNKTGKYMYYKNNLCTVSWITINSWNRKLDALNGNDDVLNMIFTLFSGGYIERVEEEKQDV